MNPIEQRTQEVQKTGNVEKDDVEMALHTLTGLLHYHQRMCLVSSHDFMADSYELSLVIAIECLKRELSR